MRVRFNPPPNWPPPPAGWSPQPGWQPDAAWGPPPPGWELWVKDQHWFSRHPVLTALLVLFVLIPLGTGLVNAFRPSDIESSLGATGQLSSRDVDILNELGQYPRRWNDAAGKFITTYHDPNVSTDHWVAAASEPVDRMRQVVRGMRVQVMAISDPGMRHTFEEIVNNYDRKLAAVIALWNAVAAGDIDGESAALQELDAAAVEGQELAEPVIDAIRPYLTPEDLERFEQEGGPSGD